MILALYKATEYWREANGFKGLKLVQVVILDQVLYYIACVSRTRAEISLANFYFRALACSVFSILQFAQIENELLANIFQGLGSPTLLCILGSRMMFNLKEAGERGVNVGTNLKSIAPTTMTEMQFV